MGKFNKYNQIGAEYFAAKEQINFGKRMNVENYGLLRANKKH